MTSMSYTIVVKAVLMQQYRIRNKMKLSNDIITKRLIPNDQYDGGYWYDTQISEQNWRDFKLGDMK